MTITDDLKELILEEVEQIAAKLMSDAKIEGDKMYWETVQEKNDELAYDASINVYNGNAGLALFWIEYYHVTGNSRYFEIAAKTLCWIESSLNSGDDQLYSFFTGKSGIIYLYCRFYEITGYDFYLESAVEIAVEMHTRLESGEIIFESADLISGVAGALLAVLYLYSIRQEIISLNIVKCLLDYILSRSCYNRKGIYWDHSINQVNGLCGMAHGVSGIAHALQEACHMFSSDGLRFACQSALAYEDSFYNDQLKNWPDFRVGIYEENDLDALITNFRKGELNVMLNGHNTNVWCHGSPGIATVRIKNATYFRNRRYDTLLSRVYTNLGRQSHLDLTFTYCHGLCGTGELLMDYATYADKNMDDNLLVLVVKNYLNVQNKEEVRNKSGYTGSGLQDSSLMNGLAGLGYFLLRCYNPVLVPSFLTLSIPKRQINETHLSLIQEWYSTSKVKEILIRGIMPETNSKYCKFRADLPTDLLVSTKMKTFSVKKKWHSKSVKKQINELNIGLDEKQDLFNTLILEHKEVVFKSGVRSNIYEFIRGKANSKILRETSSSSLRDTVIKIAEPSQLIRTYDGFSYQKGKNQHYVQFFGLYGAMTMPINNLSYSICRITSTPVSIGELVKILRQDYFMVAIFDTTQEDVIIRQVVQMINIGLLDIALKG